MGKMVQHPRNNIVSARVSDEILATLDEARGPRSRSDYISDAVIEKSLRDRQAQFSREICSRMEGEEL